MKKIRTKNYFKHYFAFTMLLMFINSAFAQTNFEVTGTVVAEDGESLIGVTVLQKGTLTATSTDTNGAFRIRVTNEQAVLVFSYVGMQLQEISVGKNREIRVEMIEKQESLDDLVVIGYGTVAKSDLTGSVSSVSSDVMSGRIVTSLEDALKGQAAGLAIFQNDGAPGSEYTIRIRGASSVNASSTPIFVIDGVIYEDAQGISPGDIESIEVLKDASSTAIYGSRGANGVIMITTKQGFEGKTRFDFYTNFGTQSPTRLYDLMNSSEYARARYQATWIYRKHTEALNPEYYNESLYAIYRDSPQPEANYWILPQTSPFRNWQNYANPDSINTNWQDVVLQNSIMQEYRLNITGGSRYNKFSIMGNYLDQEGLVINSGVEKFSGRVNFENQLTTNLNLNTNISYSKTKYIGMASGSSDGIISSMIRRPPILPFTDTDAATEDEASGDNTINPYYQAKKITFDRFRNQLVARMRLDYNINKLWLLRVTGTYVNNTNRDNIFYPKEVAQGIRQNGRAIEQRVENNKYINENFLYYKNRIKRVHRIDAMGGIIFEKFAENFLRAESQNFTIQTLGANDLGQGTVPIIPLSGTDRNAYQMVSMLGRLNYGYDERYLLTLTMRADGSSRFGPANKWGYFPSTAFAWRISEEPFIRELNIFDNFKLRLNWGISGNTAIPSFQTLSTLSTAFAPMNGVDPTFGVALDRPQNDDLKWETTTQSGVGLDLGFLHNRLSITLDGYRKVTDDLLLQMNAPLYSGYTKAWSNIGSVQNMGFEATLDYQFVQTRKWGFGVNANFGLNRSKVLDIPGEEMFFDPGIVPGSGNIITIKKGGSLGQWYGYKVDGVFKSQAEIDALPDDYETLSIKKENLRPGDRKFVDMTGDNKITSDDRTVLGSGEPLFTGGFGFNAYYGGFGINAIFQYSYGSKVFNANLVYIEGGRDIYNQTHRRLDAWTPALYDESGILVDPGNPDNDRFRMSGGGPENYLLSSFLEDGSFLRFSDLSISYDFKKKWLVPLRMESLRLFATAKNLIVWTNYYGYDPEVNIRAGGLGDFMPSLDHASYPRSRAFSVGLNITF